MIPFRISAWGQNPYFKVQAITLVAIALFAGWFLMESRYPEIGDKAFMGDASALQGVTYDRVIHFGQHESFGQRVLGGTVNWLATNKKGMMFGVMLGALLLTLFSTWPEKNARGMIPQAFRGFLLGAPLGLCVNCAAPVAQGIRAGGGTTITALTAMVSSPLFNVIALSMMVTLFPLKLTLLKIVASLVFVFAIIPLLVRLLDAGEKPKEEETRDRDTSKTTGHPLLVSGAFIGKTWSEAFLYVAKTTLRALWRLGIIMVPLMILSGLIGAILTAWIPWGGLVDFVPQGGTLRILVAIVFLAVFGVILPAPMAFDIVLVSSLLIAGLPQHYVAVLLLTIGSYSIFSFVIVWYAFSRVLAVALFIAVMAMGVGAGLLSMVDEKVSVVVHDMRLEEAIQHVRPMPPLEDPRVPGATYQDLKTTVDDQRLGFEPVRLSAGRDGLRVEGVPLAAKDALLSGPHFRLASQEETGLDVPAELSLYEITFEFAGYGRGVAAGDVHNDGWVDVVFNHEMRQGGLSLYANVGGATFRRQRLALGELATVPVVTTALVDWDNDGWLDVFFSTYAHGNYVLTNNEGSFEEAEPIALPAPESAFAQAVAFADFDRNGLLDAALGNWSVAWRSRNASRDISRSAMLWNTAGGAEMQPLPGVPGETLTMLATDIDGDGWLDVWEGNDFLPPDQAYLNEAGQNMRLVQKADALIPHTTTSTMSIASADIDNDLTPEIYLAQIAKGDRAQYNRFSKSIEDLSGAYALPGDDAAHLEEELKRISLGYQMRVDRSFPFWDFEEGSALWNEMVTFSYVVGLEQGKGEAIAGRIAPEHMLLRELVGRITYPHYVMGDDEVQTALPQIRNRNVLLTMGADGRYEDIAVQQGLDLTGWSWNAKFADFDNDQWQDLFLVNGMNQSLTRDNNTFFRNNQGAGFENQTDAFGLTDYFAISAYAKADFDNDGDLDLIVVPNNTRVRYYDNVGTAGHSIIFQLEDQVGNRYGIGSRVQIQYGDQNTLAQMRDIELSGGFLSYDPPEAHFGLGEHQTINTVEIRWSTGEVDVLEGPFQAGKRYRIERQR